MKNLFAVTTLTWVFSSAGASAQGEWRKIFECRSHSGTAELDEAFALVYGRPVWRHRLVIHDAGVGHYLEELGTLSQTMTLRYPAEVIIPLTKMSQDVPAKRYGYTEGELNYELRVDDTELKLRIFSRDDGQTRADWIFRNCR